MFYKLSLPVFNVALFDTKGQNLHSCLSSCASTASQMGVLSRMAFDQTYLSTNMVLTTRASALSLLRALAEPEMFPESVSGDTSGD